MKPFLIRFGLFACLQLLILSFVLTRGSTENRNHYFCAIYDKLARMEQVDEPRLLLVGGSNVAFGLNSRTFESLRHVPINLGLHAGLRLDFYLRVVEKRVRSGDIVLLMPEYELLTVPANPALEKDFVSRCPEFAAYFDLPAVPNQSDFGAWKQWCDREGLKVLHGKVRQAFARQEEDGTEIYSRTAFDEYGDLVAHREAAHSGGDVVGPVIPIDPETLRQSVQRMNEFAKHCRERGATVYFSYAPLPRERYTKCQAAVWDLKALFDRELQIVQLDSPVDSVYSPRDFFDSYYHLSGDAITHRSERLAQSLKQIRVASGEPNTPRFH